MSVTAEPTPAEIRRVFLGLMVVLALGALDQSIVATALPRIVADLGGAAHLSWAVTAYVLASTVTMPLYGKLSDQYGRKPLLYAAVLVFLLGSVLSGAARTMPELIVFRALQGLGAGGLLPLTQITIADLIPPAQRGRRQGAVAGVFAVCSVLGPVLGGVITDLLSWHWIFYINLPIGAAALVMVGRALRRPQVLHRHQIDYLGAALLAGATTAFLLALTLGGARLPWVSLQMLGLGLACAGLAAAFVWRERVASEPVLPLHLLSNRVFVVACIALALTFMGMLGAGVFFPLFFQMILGVSASRSGLLSGGLMIGIVVSSFVNGRVLLRTGRYKPAQVGGLAAAVLAFAVLAWGAASAQPLTVIEPALVALGVGLGLVMPNMTIAVQNAVPPRDMGAATATLAFFRSLGGAVGVAGGGAILAWQLQGGIATLPAGSGIDAAALAQGGLAYVESLPAQAHVLAVDLYRHAIASTFAAGVGVVAAAFLAAWFLPELPLRGRNDVASGRQ